MNDGVECLRRENLPETFRLLQRGDTLTAAMVAAMGDDEWFEAVDAWDWQPGDDALLLMVRDGRTIRARWFWDEWGCGTGLRSDVVYAAFGGVARMLGLACANPLLQAAGVEVGRTIVRVKPGTLPAGYVGLRNEPFMLTRAHAECGVARTVKGSGATAYVVWCPSATFMVRLADLEPIGELPEHEQYPVPFRGYVKPGLPEPEDQSDEMELT